MKIIFDNNYSLEIKPLSDNFSQQWYKEVLSVKDKIWERNRIYGLNDIWNENYCNQEMERLLNIIRIYDSKINPKFNLKDQNSLNELHHYFEKMIGLDKLNSEIKSDYFEKAPKIVKDSIVNFNVLIHRLEGINNGNKPWIVCTFKPRPRHFLPKDILKTFNFKQKPGTVCLNYCQVGKPPYDAFKDKDEFVSKENISPQTTWSADFNIQLTYGVEYHERFDQIKKEALSWCEKNNVTKEGWGRINVGEVVNLNIDRLYGIKQIKRIEI